MKNKFLERTVFAFIRHHLIPSQKVLLGLSGGPDSLALFYLLLAYRAENGLQFAIAHLDHGWRQESIDEANTLRELAQQFDVPFHLKTIAGKELPGNLEDASREERLKFFKEIVHSHGYQAVLLAHHADDQAETVLKRLLEGASLVNLSGLKAISHVHGVVLWRPLLAIKKDVIVAWLKQRNLTSFEDSTNLSAKFLRGRFRTTIIPHLAQEFGKEVCGSLCNLGSAAQELQAYLNGNIELYLSQIKRGKLGALLDLSQECPKSMFEIKYLIRQFCKNEEFFLSNELVETVSAFLLSHAANRRVVMGAHTLYIDRKCLFLGTLPLEEAPPVVALKAGDLQYGMWNVTVSHVDDGDSRCSLGWKAIWDGTCEVFLPEGDYQLGAALVRMPYSGTSSLDKWWSNHKVPAFLRHLVPVVWQNGDIKHEFLTSKVNVSNKIARAQIKISLHL